MADKWHPLQARADYTPTFTFAQSSTLVTEIADRLPVTTAIVAMTPDPGIPPGSHTPDTSGMSQTRRRLNLSNSSRTHHVTSEDIFEGALATCRFLSIAADAANIPVMKGIVAAATELITVAKVCATHELLHYCS